MEPIDKVIANTVTGALKKYIYSTVYMSAHLPMHGIRKPTRKKITNYDFRK